MTPNEKYEYCLRLYKDLINGYSVVSYEGRDIYIKHLIDLDHALFEQKKETYREQAASKGLLDEKEALQMLNETGHWSRSEEERYQALSSEIDNLKKTESKIFLESQRKVIADRVEKKENQLRESGKYRNLIAMQTVEDFAFNKLNAFVIQFSCCKSSTLRENLFTEKEFNNLSMDEVGELTSLYFDAQAGYTDANLHRISCLGVFINSFSLADSNPYYFFNKSVSDLTSHQTTLCAYGKSAKNILENSDNEMPPYTDLDDCVGWFKRERDIIKRKFSGNSSASPSSSSSGESSASSQRIEGISVPAASAEELETIGFEQGAQPMNLVEAAEKLKKKLGKDTLDIYDMVKLHS